jgi:hypothetical protein
MSTETGYAPTHLLAGSEIVRHQWDEIARLGLEDNVAELETKGLTVIPPDKVRAPGLADRLLDAILRVAEERTGARPDLEEASEAGRGKFGESFGLQLYYLLFEDKAFQEAIVNPTALAMATHLLGESCIISNCLAGVKGPGTVDLGLHCDNVMIPAPFPAYAQVCNVTWALTDYTPDAGPLVYVPGSHRFGRHPNRGEGRDQVVPVECEAGSIIFWHGNTWHGADARRRPGLRVNLIVAMMRAYLRPQEPYRENVTPEVLADNPERFAILLGQHLYYGWKEDGPDLGPLTRSPGGNHVFD